MNEYEKYVLDLKKHWEIFLTVFLYLLQLRYPGGTIWTQKDEELGILYITLEDNGLRQQIRYNTIFGSFSSNVLDENRNTLEFANKEVHEFDRLFKYRVKEKENQDEYRGRENKS